MFRGSLTLLSALVVGAAVLGAQADAAQVGAWQFDGNLDNALPGQSPMAIAGGWSAAYVPATINGSAATALSFPKMTSSQALQMPNQAGGNGGGAQTNVWTIVMDVNFPTISGFTALWQTDQAIDGSDGDFFIRGNNDGIGISGSYQGAIAQDTWNRIAVTVQPDGDGYLHDKYINGALVGSTESGTPPDGRFSLGAVLNLFADEDGETAAGLVNSVAFYDEVLSAGAIAQLGGASAAGIPAVPEPGVAVLLATAAPAVALRLRRRR